jgi:hypothetical protein
MRQLRNRPAVFKRVGPRWTGWVGFGPAFVLLLGGLLVSCEKKEVQISLLRAKLVAAAGRSRLLPGRLIGDEYAPFEPATDLKSAAPSLTDASPSVSPIRGDDERAGGNVTDRALFALFTDRLPEAAAIVEAAAQEGPLAARQANDLSALYLALAAKTRDPYNLFLALASAEQALQADGSLLEARFNRALALEGMAIDWEAKAAW